MKSRLLRTTLILLSFAIPTLVVPVLAAASGKLDISAVKAPVAPDGTTAGATTDFVITFRDPDPDVKGVSLKKGAKVEVKLDEAFFNSGGGPNIVVLLQGWPQSPPAPPPAFIWTTEVDGNTITATLDEDFKPGQFGPGAKQVHLILFGFTNPAIPGVYPFELTIHNKKSDKKDKDKKAKKKLSGSGTIRIIPDARPSVEPISLFSGPPGPPPPFFNPLYQTLALGEAARPLGLYLWDANSAPFAGVDIYPTPNPTYYELADAAGVVGEVWITPPAGAAAYSLGSVALGPGGPPSVVVPAFVTGVDVGLLGIQFVPDPWVTGDYEIAISMMGGNEKTLFVSVQD
jgi:hypothetical protein